jgi:large subunit ribosomal protein L25
MKVPLHFVNAEVSPAVKVSGAIVSHVINELSIVCLPKDLPGFIEVDLSELDTGHSLHVSGVKLPPGVTAVSHGTLDPVVATAVVPKAIVETEEEVAAAAEGAEAAGEAVAAPGAEAKPAEPKAEKGGDKKEAAKDEKKK